MFIEATESDISRSSAVSSRDSKKTKDKPKTPTKSGDLNVEESFDNGFKTSQSIFLPDIKTGIDEYVTLEQRDDNMAITPSPHIIISLYLKSFLFNSRQIQ